MTINPALSGKLTRIDHGNLGPAVLSGDGSTVVYNKWVDDEQWDVFRHRGDRIEQLTTDPRHDISPALSRDGEVVAWSHYSGKEWGQGSWDIQKHVNGKIETIARTAANESDPRVSADGSTIVWVNDDSGSPWGFDVFQEKNGLVSNLTNGGGVNLDPVPNQDGSRIYFRRKVAFNGGDLWMKDETGAIKQITDNELSEDGLTMTLDGHKIAFSQQSKEFDQDIYSFQDKGGNIFVLAGEKKVDESEPCFSGDGSILAYTRRSKGQSPQAMLQENGQSIPITTEGASFWPRLSEDGKTLTFATVEPAGGGKQEVVLYKLER